jgi:hypothetical protein
VSALTLVLLLSSDIVVWWVLFSFVVVECYFLSNIRLGKYSSYNFFFFPPFLLSQNGIVYSTPSSSTSTQKVESESHQIVMIKYQNPFMFAETKSAGICIFMAGATTTNKQKAKKKLTVVIDVD